MIFVDSARGFDDAYPKAPLRLRHSLGEDPLFDIDRIIELARVLPDKSIEHNLANLSIGHDPGAMPLNGMSPEETIRRIKECGSWIVLINIEQDPACRALMERCLAELRPAIEQKTGPMHKLASFLFVSSPNAVTPFHMDPEYNILFQIRGSKIFSVYPAHDFTMIPPEAHEAYHERGQRNIGFRDEFRTKAHFFAMTPGEALYVPLKSPHHVEVGGEVSVSYSITWRSRFSDADARLHRMNCLLRRWGAKPSLPGEAPRRDAIKVFAHRLQSRLIGPKRAAQNDL